ncbi:MAG: DUF2147 domain-containing protein [Pseudomonadota bacterium]
MSLTALTVAIAAITLPREAMDQIAGNWAAQGYGAVVRMQPCAERPDELCGQLLWVWDPEDVEPGGVGGLMLEGFRFEEDRWRGGRLTNPEDGRVYRGSIRQRDENTLDLKGCAARVLCASQTWRRLESLPHVTGLSDQP